MKKVLTIAGSDSCGGAGVQADIKTITMLGAYAESVITAVTEQNTTGVYGIEQISEKCIAGQLDCIFTDIFPDSVKIGMVYGKAVVETICDKLNFYKAKNIVTDPVMVSTSGHKLIDDEAIYALEKSLFPISKVITPNIAEAEILSDTKIHSKEDMQKATKIISERFNCNVLCKGGHLSDCSDDLLCENGKFVWYENKRIDNKNTHGTGCTLSSAIATYLALGYELRDSVRLAKEYINGALNFMLDLGKGSGPLAHNYKIMKEGK